ncbi:MAG: MFS transporter [Gammaproteobacteria bacterium]|nr:MFS transporter [Gammaproteobacteria bacterium]
MTATISPDTLRRFRQLTWTIYVVLVLGYISVYFHRMAPGVVASDLMAAFSTTGAALGSLAAMYYYIYTAMQIPAGVLADTIGIRGAVSVGNLVAGVGSILFGLAESFEVAAVGRFLVGLGVSVIFVSLMKSNAVWFSERIYGRVSGVTLLIGNLGSVLAAGPLAALLGYLSWRTVFVATGLFSLLLAVLSVWLVRNRPEDVGLPSVRELEGRVAHAPRRHHWLRELRSLLFNPRIWPGFFANFGLAGGLFAFAGLWGVPLLRDVFGLSRGDASLYTTLSLLGLAFGALAAGWFSDHLGRRKPVLVGSALIYGACWLAMLFLPWGPGWSGMLLFALLGFTGAGFVVTYPCAREVSPPPSAGMAISIVNTGLFLGAALMQPLFGWALDLAWDGVLVDGVRVYGATAYDAGLWLMFGFAVIALVATLRITETRGRNITVAD